MLDPDPDPDQFYCTYKQINIKMIIISSLPIFIKTLTSAVLCFACGTFPSGRHNADGSLMVDLCLLSCYPSFIIRKRGNPIFNL